MESTTFALEPLNRVPDVRWSAAIRDADTGRLLAQHEPETVLRTASIGKVFLLIEVARQLGAGELDPAERLSWTPDEWLADSGVWYLLEQPSLSVADLCVLIGALSDNLATNVLVRRVGIDAVRATSTRLGWVRSALLDRVRTERLPEHPPTLSQGTAGELSDVMVRLHRGEAISEGVSERVLRWLAANADHSMVASAFDLDPLAHADPDRGVRLSNKTGTISTARADIGVVVGPKRAIAYAVLANWTDSSDPRDEVLATMGRIGQEIRTAIGG